MRMMASGRILAFLNWCLPWAEAGLEDIDALSYDKFPKNWRGPCVF
jgi:hypothetical protein